MNKTAIKNFAVWARNKLIADITYRAGLIGVSEKGIAQPLPQSTPDLQFFDIGTKEFVQVAGKTVIDQRNALVRAIQEKERSSDYKTACKTVIEEVAYTWFNRLIAIRFMEVNEYLPSRIRVLSSENPAKKEPDFVTTPFDTDLEFTVEEQEEVLRLKDENKLDELFRMLFIKQCNKLHEILPELFEKTNDFTELLLNISFTDSDGIVYHLVHDIEEDDFNVEKEGQVEIIGWMYQYYNTEPKDETFALLKKNVKITKERIPAATQLFTPDWIVRYMVENSLGRLWVEGHPNDDLKANWKYYLEEAEQEPDVVEQLEKIRAEYKTICPEDVKVIDPCMGSGHILVYCFDVLMQIYESQGYTERDAAQSILKHNLYGLDIDKRAAQLSYFAVMMKARQYDRRIFSRGIKPHLYDIIESNEIDSFTAEYFANGDTKLKTAIDSIIREMHDAKEYGSILNITSVDFSALYDRFDEVQEDIHFSREAVLKELLPLVQVAEVMAQKYDVVVTNPPYMGGRNMNGKLLNKICWDYPEGKADLFSAFMLKTLQMTQANRFTAMITQHSWMFLSSFEALRGKMIENNFVNMCHLGPRAFEEIGGEVVQTTVWTSRKSHIFGYRGKYERLVLFDSQQSKERAFLNAKAPVYFVSVELFKDIPGTAFAYWLGNPKVFKQGKLLEKIANPRQGLKTLDNDYYIHFWYEVDRTNMYLGSQSADEAQRSRCKWFPINHGGEFRKYYGNNFTVVNWFDNGAEMKANAVKKYNSITRTITNIPYYFKPGITWSVLCSQPSFRWYEKGFIFSNGGQCIVPNEDSSLNYLIGLLNTKISSYLLNILSPTLGFESGYLKKLPVIMNKEHYFVVEKLAQKNIDISKEDWDSFEVSWNFRHHPLVMCTAFSVEEMDGDTECNIRNMKYIEESYDKWSNECYFRFNKIKTNEEELNRIFIDIYGLQDELTSEVEDKDITVRKADLQRDIRSLLSYAVGCMFGRYSLDTDGLAYAGGEWDDTKYSTFIPDEDNCIPITDEEYFEDDIVGLLCVWLKKVYGADTLEENLDFIADALGGKGKTSREVIRNYFLKDFFKDHCKIYQKRPIYWLFDSGKQNGFKALVYMHRWNADTVGNLRVEYLHRLQRVYDSEIGRMQEIMDNSHDNREISAAGKRKEKLQKQLKETKDYDTQIAHIALSRIDIDLDDGVKVNYEKVQTAPDGKVMKILAKI